MTYFVGALIRISGAFTNAVDAAADPTIVRVKVKKPDATVSTLVYGTDVAVIKDSVGNYHLDVNIDQAGTWCYRWEGTGAIQAASEGDLDVDEGCFT